MPQHYSREHLVLLPYHELVTLVLRWQTCHQQHRLAVTEQINARMDPTSWQARTRCLHPTAAVERALRLLGWVRRLVWALVVEVVGAVGLARVSSGCVARMAVVCVTSRAWPLAAQDQDREQDE